MAVTMLCGMRFKGLLHPKMKMFHKNTIKALFVFGTQFNILDKNQEACDCSIDCPVNTTVKVQKSMKSIARVVHLPSVVQSEFYEATRILFVRKENKNNDFFSTICLLSVSPRQRNAILDITHRTQVVYALLYPLQCKDAYSTCIYTLILMKISHPCVEADAEERTLLAFDG